VQQNAVNLALDDPGVDQADERLEQHFADAVEAFFRTARFRNGAAAGASRFTVAFELRAVAMGAGSGFCASRVTDLTDTDLQCAAIAHETCGREGRWRIWCQ